MIPSNDVIRENYYLVSRGARPLAFLGQIEATVPENHSLYTKLNTLSWQEDVGGGGRAVTPIPFVIPWDDCNYADAGFAARSWVVETLKWVGENAPQEHRRRLMGLLLGYSVDVIALNDELDTGAMFPNTAEDFERLPPDSNWRDKSAHIGDG